jgi:hypothetical protein
MDGSLNGIIGPGASMADRQIGYLVSSVNGFAAATGLSAKEAFLYLDNHKGIEFLKKFYDIEHTLPPEMTIEALMAICQNNGGDLQ